MTPDTSRKVEIDWLKTTGGAFAAVSSAVLLSTLGAAGTIIGAALGSVIVTVGGALYSQGLARSQQRLVQVQTAAKRKAGAAHAEERLDEVNDDLASMTDEPAGPGWRERLGKLSWKRISLIAAGLFVAAVLAITAFELAVGQSVSSITGGSEGSGRTTIGRLSGGSDEDAPTEENRAPSDEESSDQPAPTDEPTDEPTPAPESETPSPTPSAPTTDETAEPTDPATTSPTG